MSNLAPKTAVVMPLAGMGDLVWHVPYFRAVAQQSADGVVAVIAKPSTFAAKLLSAEPCVAEVLYYDRHPRRSEKRHGQHSGLRGFWRMVELLKSRHYDRIVLFSGKRKLALLARAAGIPDRLGYGFNGVQRVLLNHKPYITAYHGPAVGVYKDATAFALAHGFCDRPQVPRMTLPDAAVARASHRVAHLRRPLWAFAIGASETYKQWGSANFAGLAQTVIGKGGSVALIGGPMDAPMAAAIVAGLAPDAAAFLTAFTGLDVVDAAAVLQAADVCVGNDTGMLNVAAACRTRTCCLLGPRELLEHDPELILVRSKNLRDIQPAEVMAALTH
ncbi:MAG TPA: glycosyltransferase family 9 protein [Nevskiaceae bacterium]|nr:glycosyltransferase family 9 protein [Nevskiaceae bacterium]